MTRNMYCEQTWPLIHSVRFAKNAEGIKFIRIKKKRAREMSRSSKVSRTFEFLLVFGAAEAEFFSSHSVIFGQENENSNVDNFFLQLDKNPPMSS